MKGILFKDWKIKAIAEDDREWQTRRVIKPQPDKGLSIACYTVNGKPIDWVLADEYGDPIDSKCPQPRYQVGEVVYIKEGYWVQPNHNKRQALVHYKAEGNKLATMVGWQSPLFMPAWAARLFIKITDVRVGRLQEINPQDIRKEGIDPLRTDFDQPLRQYERLDREEFIDLWDSINPKYLWESNPWVFVYSFKKAEK